MTSRTRPGIATAAAWTAANPILAVGEIGIETDTGQMKIGDGTTKWATLAYTLTNVVASQSTAAAARSALGLGSAAVADGEDYATAASVIPQDETDFVWFCDFLVSSVAANGWGSTVSGTGAGSGQGWPYITNGGQNVLGVLEMRTGSTATGRFCLSTYNNSLLVNTGFDFTFETRTIFSALSTASEEYRSEIGFGNQWTSTSWPSDSIVFRYDRATDGDFWSCVTRRNNVETKTVTTVEPAAGIGVSFDKLGISISADGLGVDFTIAGVKVATHTANIPQNTDRMGIGLTIDKSAGTTERELAVDWTRFRATRTTAR